MNDPISDFITRIKNAYMARKGEVSAPHSKMKEAIAEVLKRYGYISSIETKTDGVKKQLIVGLNYVNKMPKFTDVEIISKPGKRVYVPYNKIPKVLGGLGITVVSTPVGIMSGVYAKKKKLGGELICKIW